MKTNNIMMILGFVLICSLTLNMVLYGHSNEQKTLNIDLGKMLKTTQNEAENTRDDMIRLENDKTRLAEQYTKANYYIMAGDSCFIASCDNFDNDFIYDAHEQKNDAIGYYEDALETLKRIQSATNDEKTSSDIIKQIEFVECGIRYFEADNTATKLYIQHDYNHDDYALRNRYYDKYLDAHDTSQTMIDDYNRMYDEMLLSADIVLV